MATTIQWARLLISVRVSFIVFLVPLLVMFPYFVLYNLTIVSCVSDVISQKDSGIPENIVPVENWQCQNILVFVVKSYYEEYTQA